MRADFFVHPYASRLDGIADNSQIESYENYLEGAVRSAECGALVYSMAERDTIGVRQYADFSSLERFESGVKFPDNSYRDGGWIGSPSEFKRLYEFIEKRDVTSAVVHGSYLGMCTHHFALQVFGILNGFDIFSPMQEIGDSGPIVNQLAELNAFKVGNVKLGKVLHHPFYDTEGLYRDLEVGVTSQDSSPTSAVAQFFGPETMIFEMGLQERPEL